MMKCRFRLYGLPVVLALAIACATDGAGQSATVVDHCDPLLRLPPSQVLDNLEDRGLQVEWQYHPESSLAPPLRSQPPDEGTTLISVLIREEEGTALILALGSEATLTAGEQFEDCP